MIFKQIKYFAITILLIGVTPIFYLWGQYQTESNAIQFQRESEAKHQLNFSQKEVHSIASKLSTSLKLLSGNRVLLEFIQDPSLKNRSLLESLWALTATNYSYISQIRLIGIDGQEISRINEENGTLTIVPENELQDKSHRDYFIYAQTLKTDAFGFFGIDLDVEHGSVVTPPKPSLRIFTPIEINNERKGYLFFNLDIYEMVDKVEASLETGYQLEFVNEEGYYLASQDKRKTLGHLIAERESYNVLIETPELWQEMRTQNTGEFADKQFFYSFAKVSLGDNFGRSSLYLLLSSENNLATENVDHKLTIIIYEAILAILFVTFISILIARYIAKHRTTSIENQLALAALNGMSAIVITDKNNRIIKVNEEFTSLSGWREEDVIGRTPSMFQSGKHNKDFYSAMWRTIQSEGLWEGEVINQRKDGNLLTEILRIQAIYNNDGKREYFIASFVDITERKELENRLRELSEKDSLTQCWNRRRFEREFSNIIANDSFIKGNESSCLAIIDIDYFKRINDKYGHDVGDKVIAEVGRILGTESRRNDFVARIGGEEFAVILPNTQLQEAEMILNRLRVAINLYDDIKVTISGGVTDICNSRESSYKRADLALYESKASGRNQISCFSSDEMTQIA
ncbi:diguanylate cyclase [Aliivibrio finisterrensis]|uniref:diguanylate cyclase n=1 Tax=Aliivibrio finisterrensis TaxID=511998 RepID=A0A4Q5KTL6_9GAMM|nr:diguanylate cyclase [Aliivibrio finisterrensis]RYU55645.1 diguanylate cyclase [Aliivibrio finisterrensis]RYU60401.1 diguanylate cyclase [Aliivibrio finisterrensis]RYU83692.1 diguanylate cyclase [Aliivibrio finisterrensis]